MQSWRPRCWHRCTCAGSEWEILEWLLANPREMDKIRTLDMEVQEGGCPDNVFASLSLWGNLLRQRGPRSSPKAMKRTPNSPR